MDVNIVTKAISLYQRANSTNYGVNCISIDNNVDEDSFYKVFKFTNGFNDDGFGIECDPPITWNDLKPFFNEAINFEYNIDIKYKRSEEYPKISEQLDDLYHQGAFSPEMSARILAVKEKYPKKILNL